MLKVDIQMNVTFDRQMFHLISKILQRVDMRAKRDKHEIHYCYACMKIEETFMDSKRKKKVDLVWRTMSVTILHRINKE